MNKKLLAAIASTLTLGAVAVPAAMAEGYMGQSAVNWTGPYVGGRIGWNNSDVSNGSNSRNTFTGGVQAGYNVDLGGPVVGAEGFVDWNGSKAHDTVFGPVDYGSYNWGADAKLGVGLGPLMPYGKIGLAHTNLTNQASGSAWGLHSGLGVEYKFMPNMSAKAEWTFSRANLGFPEREFKNNNFTVGVNYYFQ